MIRHKYKTNMSRNLGHPGRRGMSMRKGMVALALLSVFSCGLRVSVAAEPSYPTKPIELWAGYAPGAGTDLGARMLAENSKKYLGQEVTVVNKPGGGGRVAMTLVSKTKPDGYSLAAVTDSTVVFSPYFEEVPYKPLEDFTFVSSFGTQHFGMVVAADSPFNTVKDLVDFARANPGKLSISTTGVGNNTHVAWEAIALLENLKVKIVPFSGAAPAVTNLLGGHVMVACTGSSGYALHLKAKKVKLLAILSEERMEIYPNTPTLKELGYPITFQGLYIVAGPKNMGKPVVKKLEEAFKKATEAPSFIKLAEDLETYSKRTLSSDELSEAMVRLSRRNGELFKKLGMGLKQ